MDIRHKDKFSGVNKQLVDAVMGLDLPFDITIVYGKRTVEEQEALFKAGKSQLHGKNAPHVLGLALDICPLDENSSCDWTDKSKFLLIRSELQKTIKLSPLISWDLNHFQIEV